MEGARRSCVSRRCNLAFISQVNGQERSSGYSIAKFYDPLTLTEQLPPGSAGRGFKTGDAVRVEYAVRPAGTWRHASYSVTPEIPYEPSKCLVAGKHLLNEQGRLHLLIATCLKTREESYDVIGAKKLSKEVRKQYEDIYDRTDGREEDQRATAIEEVLMGRITQTSTSDRVGVIAAGAAALQSKARAAQKLYSNTFRPTLEREDEDEVILRSSYYPRGSAVRAIAEDLSRAARVFRFNQHLSVIPQGNRGDYGDRFTLVPIRSSKVHKDHIAFTFAMRKGLAEDLWDEEFDSLIQKPWEFKVSQQQVLQRHFLKKLRDGEIRQLFVDPQHRTTKQIIKVSRLPSSYDTPLSFRRCSEIRTRFRNSRPDPLNSTTRPPTAHSLKSKDAQCRFLSVTKCPYPPCKLRPVQARRLPFPLWCLSKQR